MEEKIERLRKLLKENYDDTGSYVSGVIALVITEEIADKLIVIIKNVKPSRDVLLMYAMDLYEENGGNLGE